MRFLVCGVFYVATLNPRRPFYESQKTLQFPLDHEITQPMGDAFAID